MSCKDDTAAAKTRRDFLWGTVKTFTFGAITLTAIPMFSRGASAEEGDGDKPAGEGKPPAKEGAEKPVLFGYIVDTTKCIGCSNCMVACQYENDVPDGQFRTWVERYVYRKDGKIEVDMNTKAPFAFAEKLDINPEDVTMSFFVPKLCNHCVNTPCIQVCPVGASFMTKEGVVLIDPKHCIGCSYCVQACPFGTRFINHETQVADKCTWCYHRVMKGLRNACVEVCPVNARMFGNLDDPESDVSKLLRTHRIDVLKSYLGTRPKTRYIGLTAEVV